MQIYHELQFKNHYGYLFKCSFIHVKKKRHLSVSDSDLFHWFLHSHPLFLDTTVPSVFSLLEGLLVPQVCHRAAIVGLPFALVIGPSFFFMPKVLCGLAE